MMLGGIFPDLLNILESFVKPERDKLGDNPDGRRRRQYWWRWGRDTPTLYRTTSGLPRIMARSLTSAHFSTFALLPPNWIYDQTLLVFAFNSLAPLSVLSSRVHEAWVRFFGATFKDDSRYNLADCFNNFPFPLAFAGSPEMEEAAQAYCQHRATMMVARNEGLTKTYNRFHKSTEKSADIVKLRSHHAEMDAAVLRAYGWDDLASSAKAEFVELPTDPGKKPKHRLFWPNEVQDEVLKRLLALNAERAEQEKRSGLAPTAVVDDVEDPDSDPEANDEDDEEDDGEQE